MRGLSSPTLTEYRDLPQIISEHVHVTRALDFGCGTGRSTRFVRQLGFDIVSVDIAPEMIAHARRLDPEGDYRLIRGPQSGRFCRAGVVSNGDFSRLEPRSFDLVLSLFTFDNIPGTETRVNLFRGLRALLNDQGKLVRRCL